MKDIFADNIKSIGHCVICSGWKRAKRLSFCPNVYLKPFMSSIHCSRSAIETKKSISAVLLEEPCATTAWPPIIKNLKFLAVA